MFGKILDFLLSLSSVTLLGASVRPLKHWFTAFALT